VRRHALPGPLLDVATSGVVGEELASVLASAEYSLRLVALRAVLDAARREASDSPLDGIDTAWDLLVRVDVAAPEAARLVLSYPSVGSWARTLLRRLRAAPPPAAEVVTQADPAVPLWVEVGYLHSLAAAAAIRAGLAFGIRVPAVQGTVVLPTLGLVSIPGPGTGSPGTGSPETGSSATAASAWVRGTGGRVVVDVGRTCVVLPRALDRDAPSWRALRAVRVEEAGTVLAVSVDDVDPYRMIAGRAPARPLSAGQSARWQEQVTRAWRLLVAIDRDAAGTMGRMLRAITPLDAAERFGPRSASSADSFGRLLASAPDDAAQLAAVLVHEMQHGKLGALMHLSRLHHPATTRLFYAPWRDDPRPLPGLVQGIYAFAGVSWFWRAHRHRAATEEERRLAEFEFALWRGQASRAAARLRGEPALTDLGAWFVERVRRWVRPWLSEPLPPLVLDAADLAVVEHRTGWRLHHVQPAAPHVEALARAWVAGKPAARRPPDSPPSTVRPTQPRGHLETTAVLLRYRLADRDTFAAFLADPAAAAVTGASAAQVLVAGGRYDEARRALVTSAAADPASPDPWVGLTLCLRRTQGAGPVELAARRSLSRHPELVRAVAHRLAATDRWSGDPIGLAAWLDGHTPPPSG
jgi:HEXXH motif-containing protein